MRKTKKKYIRLVLVIITLLTCTNSSFSQNYKKVKPYSWMLGVYWNAMEDDGYRYERLFDFGNSWNMPAFPTSINADFYMMKGMSIDIVASYNEYKAGNTINLDTNRAGKAFALSAHFKYSFGFLMRQQVVDPFVFGGFGYTGREALWPQNMLSGNVGAGVNVMIWRGLGIQIRTTGKIGLLPEIYSAEFDYLHHHFGLIYKFPELTGGYNNFHKRKYKWGHKNYRYRKPKGM